MKRIYWVMVGTNIATYFSPPLPIPGVSKSLLPGGDKMEKYTILVISHNFY